MSTEQKQLFSGENFDTYHHLFQDCFPETAGTTLESLEHYLWKYGPEGKETSAYEFAAYEGGRVLGYYAALPFAYRVGGRRTIAGLVCDVMTHSTARGKGIFTSQGRFATNKMRENGVDFCTGYPIRSYVFPGHLKVGWRVAFALPVYAKLLDLRPVASAWRASYLGSILQPLCRAYQQACRLCRPRLKGVHCEEKEPAMFFSSKQFVAFYEQWAKNAANHLIRSERFYRWRLSAPKTSFIVTALYRDAQLVGYALTRNSPFGGFQITDIVDFLVLPEDQTLVAELHDALARISIRSGAAGVVVMTTKSNAARWKLIKNGYFRSTVTFKLILKWLSDEPTPPCFWEESAWHLTWLDTDTL